MFYVVLVSHFYALPISGLRHSQLRRSISSFVRDRLFAIPDHESKR